MVIWREPSPVPEGADGRLPADGPRYNAVAAKAIAEVGGIETDLFFTFAETVADLQQPANVHYTAEGSKALSEHVVEVICQRLPAAE